MERGWVKLTLYIGIWTLLGFLSAIRLMLSYAYSGYTALFGWALAVALADWYEWAALTPAIAWLARHFAIERRNWLRSLLVHLPASLFFSILKMVIEFQVYRLFDPRAAAGLRPARGSTTPPCPFSVPDQT